MQIIIAVLSRTLYHYDNVPLARRGVDSVHVFQITVRTKNL